MIKMRVTEQAPPRARRKLEAGIVPEHRRTFVLLWLAFFVIGMGWGFTVPLFPVVIVDAGLPVHTYGLLQSYAALGSMLAQTVVGRLSDRMGRRKPILLASLVLMAPVVAVFPRVEVATVFGLLLACHSILQNAFRIMINAWVRSLADSSALGRSFGTMRIAGSLGWIVATPLLGAVTARFHQGATFEIAAGIYIASALFIGFGVRELVAKGAAGSGSGTLDANTERDGGVGPVGETSAGAASRTPTPAELRSVLLFFFLALGLFQLAQSMGISFNSIYLKEELGLSDTAFGWMFSLQAWLEVPLMITLGAMSDRIDSRRMLAVTIGLSGLRWLLLSVVGRSAWLIPVQLLHAVGVTVSEVLAVAFVARYVARERLATVLGWKVAVQNAALLMAPALGGYISHAAGLQTMFQVAAALALAAAAVILLTGRRAARGNAEPRVGA